MTPKEKLAMLFAAMDVWQIMSIHFLHKDPKIVQAKKDFIIDNALKHLAPNMMEDEVIEYHKEMREEGVIDYLTGLLQQKHDLDKILKSFKTSNKLFKI